MMEQDNYLTPRKFLQCCGVEKLNCTEILLGTYLGEKFLQLPIYDSNGNFDTYFISQTEPWSARFFMDPPNNRHSLSKQKSQDIYEGMDDEVLSSIVDAIEERIANPVLKHPDFETMKRICHREDWKVDQEAWADILTAKTRRDSVKMMILLLAALFQDYYGKMGICRKVRGFLQNTQRLFPDRTEEPVLVMETPGERISPVTDLHTEQTYVHRADLLEAAEEKLNRLEYSGEKRFLLFYGASGDGKSELARAYAREHLEELYEREYWLTCPDGKEQISFGDLCRTAGPVYGTGNLRGELAGAGSDVLIVVDNCNVEVISLINELYYHTGEATVLITSRLSSLSGFDERNALRVFSDRQEEFCFEVFRKNYEKKMFSGVQYSLLEEEEQYAIQICRRVHLNPLFISMAASFLREHKKRISIQNFCRNLEKGLLDAFPKYSQLDFRKDASEPLRLEPIEVLRVIFKEELNCIRIFSPEERQIMNLMLLFPAEPISAFFLSEILGDNEDQWLMERTIKRLLSLSLLQQEGDKIMIHPLLCELIQSGVSMEDGIAILYSKEERGEFFSHILKNIFLFEPENLQSCIHLVRRIYHNIPEPSVEVKILFHAMHDKYMCKALLAEEYPEQKVPMVIAYWRQGKGKIFVLHDLLTRKSRLLLDLSKRAEVNRYYGRQSGELETCRESEKLSEGTEAVLLLLWEGNYKGQQPFPIDLSGGIDGHPIFELPMRFMRQSKLFFTMRFPVELKGIGDWAFDNCGGMVGPLELPDRVEKIGHAAFHNCNHLTGHLKLPKSLAYLGDSAFCLCGGFTGGLTLPEGLQYLGDMAFAVCSGLHGRVVCPKGLKQIGERIFYMCGRLDPSPKFRKLSTIQNKERSQEGKTIYIPECAECIENEAFYGRTDLVGELKLPATVKEIGALAFYSCRRLRGSLQFSSSLKKIGEGAFFGCASLTGSVDLPDTLESIGDGAFYGCMELNGGLRLPRRIREIPTAIFFMCRNMEAFLNLEELSDLRVIGEGAFFGCESLSGELYLPENLETIGEGAFDSCQNLTGVYFSRSGKIKRLKAGCFHNCSGLEGTLHIPISIEEVEIGAFQDTCYDTCIVHSRNCKLEGEFVDQDVLIVGYSGSTAEEYAAKYGNPFRVLE